MVYVEEGEEMDIGKIIKARRIELGYSLDDIGKYVGVGKSTVRKWETGMIKNMRRDKIALLAKVLQMSPVDFINHQDVTRDLPSHPSILPIKRRKVPLLGAIACGEPLFADASCSTYAILDDDVECDFALKCKGDSMTGARIYDGDIVFIRKQEYVDDGTIAAVLIEDEATLKRVYKLSDGRVELRAENPKYKPIIIGGESEVRTAPDVIPAYNFSSLRRETGIRKAAFRRLIGILRLAILAAFFQGFT